MLESQSQATNERLKAAHERIAADAQANKERIAADAQAATERYEAEDRRMEAFDRRLEYLAERDAALAMNIELMSRDHEARHKAAMAEREKDGQHINALVRIAEIHERRVIEPRRSASAMTGFVFSVLSPSTSCESRPHS